MMFYHFKHILAENMHPAGNIFTKSICTKNINGNIGKNNSIIKIPSSHV